MSNPYPGIAMPGYSHRVPSGTRNSLPTRPGRDGARVARQFSAGTSGAARGLRVPKGRLKTFTKPGLLKDSRGLRPFEASPYPSMSG